MQICVARAVLTCKGQPHGSSVNGVEQVGYVERLVEGNVVRLNRFSYWVLWVIVRTFLYSFSVLAYRSESQQETTDTLRLEQLE